MNYSPSVDDVSEEKPLLNKPGKSPLKERGASGEKRLAQINNQMAAVELESDDELKKSKRFKQIGGQQMGKNHKFRGSQAAKENKSMRSDRSQRMMYGISSK